MILRFPPALRHRGFALLWSGLLVSIAGSQMQLAALHWHLRALTDQPIWVSGIGMARILPIILIAPFGGLFADTHNRRKILFVTQSIMAATALTLGLLTYLHLVRIWHIYLITAIQAVAVSFDSPARQSLVPNLMPRDALPSAFSLQSIAMNIGAVIGPAMSGIVIATLGQEYTYLINAASFSAVLLALALMGPIRHEVRPAVRGARASLLSIREGWDFITHQPIILSSMVLDFMATFFSSARTLLPFVVKDILRLDELAYGWLVSAESAGAVLVGVIMSQRSHVRRQGTLLLTAVTFFGLATILLGFSRTFALAAAAQILIGIGDSISTILRNTIRQLQTPDYIRGRMVSINQIFFQGGPQLGEIEAGLVAQAFGLPFAIISGGVGCILGVLVIGKIWPQLPRYRGDEPVPLPVTPA